MGEVYANNTGNAALSKAGTGDVLTGLIAGFISQGAGSLDSLLLSAWLHGKSGELASTALTEYCVMASDIIKYLPHAIKILQGDENIV
jgi:NAD(P)H-hydrate epimerase